MPILRMESTLAHFLPRQSSISPAYSAHNRSRNTHSRILSVRAQTPSSKEGNAEVKPRSRDAHVLLLTGLQFL